MTLPNERYRAVRYAREFMRDLLDPKKTPKVPRSVRERAYSTLKHFPGDYDMEMVAEEIQGVFENDGATDEQRALEGFRVAVKATLNKTAKKITKKGAKPKKPS